ncbi:putative uncharacterized hydrolase [Lachnellula hyalina]|uniref:Uncharacterized hydrolase n=1 Tax=Lachnellula hyalina TaxID=1316788 RepID=A0A8H8R9L0_9HELO|nr:putative uncharacterized hydrolase [Lachnellula hyalina]TVY30498.1 putative uncharacterized hydrolase [Lachnellula hyalina]
MTTPLLKEPRRFAPLKEGVVNTSGAPKLKGIVFDVDGTLCVQQNYMFGQMRSALNITKATDILDHCHSLPPAECEEALEKIRNVEREAMVLQEAQPGLVPLMTYLESKNLPKGICTRNFETPVNHLLSKFLEGKTFSPIVTRDFRPPKPSPEGILFIAKTWGFVGDDGKGLGEELIMVGAGAATVLLVNEMNAHLATHEHTDLVISRLDELIEILEKGFVGRIARGDEDDDLKGRAEGVLRDGKGEE